MKGKKSDPEFVAKFIQESVMEGHETPEAITKRAHSIIAQIDEQIKEVEKLKTKRSKLLDVVATFERPVKNKDDEAKLLSFFKLEYPRTCKFICGIVKEGPITIGENLQPLGSGETDPQLKFSIKQLLECKVLSRTGNHVGRGDRFDEYMKFVLREV